jgi:hypothetical protein
MFALIAALHAQEAPPVVGGEETEEYPGVVYLLMGDHSGYPSAACSGTLIAESWVLTAAHCLTDPDTGWEPYYVSAYVGPSAEAWVQEAHADAWFTHPEYDGITGYNDVALVHLSTTYQGVAPVALSQQAVGDADLGVDFRVVGFGLEGEGNGAESGRKKFADIPLEFYNEKLFMVYDEDAVDAVCSGDSGGPVLRVASDGSYSVAGVINFGPVPPSTCAGNAGANARVDYFLTWIDLYTTDYSVKGEANEGDPRWSPDQGNEGGVHTDWDDLEPVDAPTDDGGLLGALGCSSTGVRAVGAMASVLAAFAARRRQR